MFAKKHEVQTSQALTAALIRLKTLRITDDEYAPALENVIKLQKLHTETKWSLPSPDTLASGAFNILGILLVTKWESNNVIASKALGLAFRVR